MGEGKQSPSEGLLNGGSGSGNSHSLPTEVQDMS